MKKIFPLLTTFLLLLFISSCDDDDSNTPVLEAGFTYTVSATTGTVTFINTSTEGDTYLWDFGDGTTSTEINPIKVYPTGTYVVTLTVTNGAGATSTFEDTILISIPGAPSLPITYDATDVIYEPTTFNGASFEVVANPAPGGSNDVASNVGAITNSGANFEGITYGLSALIDLTTDKTITMNFWADAAVDVLLKLEQGTEGDIETTASHGGTGWEQLVFTFDSSAEYGAITIFVDGPGTTSGTFYIDDITQVATIDNVVPVITLNGDATVNLNTGDAFTDPGATATDNVDGDISANIVVGGDTVDTNTEGTYVITYNVTDAAGNAATEVTRTVVVSDVPVNASLIIDFEDNLTGVTTAEFETGGALIANPVSGGINTSANVYEATYTNANQWWGGIGLTFADGVLDQSATSYRVKLYSTVANTNVLFQVEVDGTNAPVGNVQTISTANEWVEVTFTLDAAAPAGLNRILIRPDVGNQDGTKPNSGTLYIDDIECIDCTVGGGSGGGGGCTGDAVAATSLPVDFEGCESFINTFASADGGVTTSLVANPNASGINTSANVMQVVRASGINRWGGLQNSFPAGTIDITTNTFKVQVYSSMNDVTYRFELALDPQTDPVTGNPPPTFVTVNGGANTWTEIEFTFTGLPATPTTYNQLVIKPDNPDGSDGDTLAADQTFYFDNLRLD